MTPTNLSRVLDDKTAYLLSYTRISDEEFASRPSSSTFTHAATPMKSLSDNVRSTPTDSAASTPKLHSTPARASPMIIGKRKFEDSDDRPFKRPLGPAGASYSPLKTYSVTPKKFNSPKPPSDYNSPRDDESDTSSRPVQGWVKPNKPFKATPSSSFYSSGSHDFKRKLVEDRRAKEIARYGPSKRNKQNGQGRNDRTPQPFQQMRTQHSKQGMKKRMKGKHG